MVGAVGARACGIGRHSDARAPGIFRVYLRILGYTRVLPGRPPGSVRGCSRNDQNGEGQNVLHVLVRTDPSCRSRQLSSTITLLGRADEVVVWVPAQPPSVSRCAPRSRSPVSLIVLTQDPARAGGDPVLLPPLVWCVRFIYLFIVSVCRSCVSSSSVLST